MVEKIIVNPEEIRGLGNIVSPHSIEDYELYNSTLEESTATIGGVETVVYDMDLLTSDITVTLTISSASVTIGSSVTLTATVLDDETPVSGEDVTFKIGTTTLGTGTTNSSGVATYSYTTDTVGTFGLTASYGHVTSTSVSLTVNKHTTTSVLTVDNTSVIVGTDVLLQCTVTDESNNPVTDEYVDFYANWGTEGYIAPAKTNSNGVASVSYHTNRTGNIQLYARFSQTSLYSASQSNNVAITVSDHAYSVAFSQSSYAASGGSATLELTLTDNSVPVSGATISISGSDSSSYSCITNSSGVGTVTVTGVSSETSFTATYSNVSDTCTVTVAPAYLFYDSGVTGTKNTDFLCTKSSSSYTVTVSDNDTRFLCSGSDGYYIPNIDIHNYSDLEITWTFTYGTKYACHVSLLNSSKANANNQRWHNAGSSTPIATWYTPQGQSTISRTITSGDTMKLVKHNNTFTLYVNGISIGNSTTPSWTVYYIGLTSADGNRPFGYKELKIVDTS